MYEPRHHPPLSRKLFARRIVRHFLFSQALVFVSILGGMTGYHHFENLPWVDSFLNTAMLLGGMGEVDTLRTEAGKLFAGFFALYAGLVFLIVAAVLAAPVLHRVLHKFHWDQSEK